MHIERHAASKRGKRPGAAKGYGREWAMVRAKVFAAKGAQCVYCGADAWHVDHVVPKCRGGTDDLDNLVPACSACNTAKGARSAGEWRA